MRGGGGPVTVGADGLAAMVGACAIGAAGRGGAASDELTLAGAEGGAGGGTVGRGATGVADATGAAVCTGTGGAGAGGGAGTVNVGLGVEVGTTNFGGATGGAGAFGTGAAAAGGITETAGLGGGGVIAGGASGVAGPCCLLIMARNASPGLEILERSILVLISSPSGRFGREDRPALWAWLAARRRARTLSASWSSRELE